MHHILIRIGGKNYYDNFWYIYSMISYLIESDTDVSIEIEDGVSNDFITDLAEALEESYSERHLRRIVKIKHV